MPAQTLVELLEEQARKRPEAVAIAAPGQRPSTFSELSALVGDVGSQLCGLGFVRRDRIALAVSDSAEAAVALVSVSAVSVAAPLPPATPADECGRLLARLGARAVVVRRGADTPMAVAAAAQGIAVLEIAARSEGPAGSFDLTAPAGAAPSRPGPEDVAVVLHTSGTTSEARRVPFTHAQLCLAGRAACEFAGLGPEDRGLSFAPLFHLAGLYYAIVYPLASGGGVFVTPGFVPDRFFEWLREARPSYFGASPAAHQAILDRALGQEEAIGSAPLRLIRSAAAPLSGALRERLEATFRVPVTDVYALTEAGVVTGLSAERSLQKPGSVGRPTGAEVRVVDESGQALAAGVVGEIVVRGNRVMKGYDGDEEATLAAFFGEWLRTGDEGFLDSDGYLTITGRLRERINRGGEKISPREVDEALLAHPDVAEAAAFGVAHPRLGEDLAAVVVLRPGAAMAPATLRAFVAARLAPFKVPSRIVFQDALPRSPTGKLPRRKLAGVLGSTNAGGPVAAGSRTATPSSSVLEEAIAEQLSRVLGVSSVSADDDFFDLGGDSVAAAALMARLHERLGVSLPVSVLFEAPSAGALAEHVGKTEGASWGPLVPLRARGSGRALFFVHAIGGGVMFLSRLAARLEGRPFFGLQAPGFDGREPPLTDVARLAAHYLGAVRQRQPQGPYLLGGFCMGSAVALEMARQLEQEGQQVSLLVLLDPPPLPLGARRRPLDRLKVALSALSNRLRGHEPGPLISPAEAPLLQANRRALRRYRPRPVQAPLALFFAEHGPPEPAEEAEHALRRLTRGGVRVERISAGHVELFEEPAVEALAARIETLLAGLEAGPA